MSPYIRGANLAPRAGLAARWASFTFVMAAWLSPCIILAGSPGSLTPTVDPGTTSASSTIPSPYDTTIQSTPPRTETPTTVLPPVVVNGKPLPPAISREEEKIGKEGFKEVQKEYDFVKDEATLTKLRSIVGTLEKATPYPNLAYTVNIIKSKRKLPEPEINAFSMPGGYIFVTKDLLDTLQSDDELAAVLGHEMAHVVHHHVIKQIQAAKHDQLMSMLADLGALIAERGHPGGGTASVAMMGPQIAQALQSKHSIYDETEADLSGVQYMHDSGKYNPNGMMTFMQRLAIEENDHPEVELGYLQDHPSSDHRVADIQAKLHALGVPINPRAVSRVLTAVVTDGATSTSAQLQFRQEKTPVLLCLLKATIHGLNAVERARQAAQKINEGIDQKRVLGAMEAREVPEGTEVLWEGTEVLTFAPQDIPSGKTGQDVAKQFIQQIKQTIFADEVARS